MISNKLISHQVFEAIQGGISDSPMGRGTILFANKYTGSPVEMDEEVRAAISHDGTFIGNNPINQLEKAFAGVPGGPWVIDVRNEILYIHNKAIDQPATYDYVYGSENGELLKISFKTQYITKNVPRGGTMSFDQFNKTLRISSHSQTSADEVASDETDREAIKQLYNQAHQARLKARASTMYPRANGQGRAYTNPAQIQTFIEFINSQSHSTYTDLDSLYSIDLETLVNWYDKYIEYLKQRTSVSLKQYERSSSGSDLRYMRHKESEGIYNSKSYDEFKELIADFLNKTLGEPGTRYRNEVEAELRRAFKQGPEAVREVLHRYFDNTTYSIYTHTATNEVKDLPLESLLGQNDVLISSGARDSGPTRYHGKEGRVSGQNDYMVRKDITRYLEDAGATNVVVTLYDKKEKSSFLWSKGYWWKVKVSYRANIRNYYTVSGYQFMYDYYLRYTGSPNGRYSQYVRGQALGANTSRKITDQRVEVEMLVVGRPSLTSNEKIKISNIGSKSGDYIIKRCIHQITPGEGYTCSLTLAQGSHNEPVGTVSTEVPITSKPGETGGGTASGGGQRTKPDGKGGVVNTRPTEPIVIFVTPAERAYFVTLLTSEDSIAKQEEFITQLKYSREQAYLKARQEGKSEAEAREAVRQVNMRGIVSIKNKNVSSDNLYLKENLQPHYQQIPQRYRVAYRDEVMRILRESAEGIKSRLG